MTEGTGVVQQVNNQYQTINDNMMVTAYNNVGLSSSISRGVGQQENTNDYANSLRPAGVTNQFTTYYK